MQILMEIIKLFLKGYERVWRQAIGIFIVGHCLRPTRASAHLRGPSDRTQRDESLRQNQVHCGGNPEGPLRFRSGTLLYLFLTRIRVYRFLLTAHK